MVYEGTYGIFSVALVITIAYSYAMEKNESLENVVMYVVVALAAFSAQLNLGTEDFDVAGLGTTGCFAAMFIGYLSCMAFSKLRRCHKLMLEQYTAGMGGGCVLAIRTLIPLGIVAAGSGGLNLLIGRITGIYGCYQWFNHIFYAACQNIADYSNFLSGLLYTFAVNLMWFFGLHGSHILEAVAVHNFGVTGNVVFSKAFYDVYVAMGGCGTTVSVLIALLLFFRKERTGKLAGLASFTVVFNLNEMLTFGIPIILNPIFVVPFMLVPLANFLITYAAIYSGLVPHLVSEVNWTTPIFLSGYQATGSWAGAILQMVCLAVGVCIYMPFIRL